MWYCIVYEETDTCKVRNSVAQQQCVSAADQSETSRQLLSLPSNLSLLFFFSSSPINLLICYWGWGRGRGALPKARFASFQFYLMKSVRAHHSSELLENLTVYNKSWAGQNPSCSCVSLQAKTEGTVNQEHARLLQSSCLHTHGLKQ